MTACTLTRGLRCHIHHLTLPPLRARQARSVLLNRRRPRDPVQDLSDREHDVLRLMAADRSNQAIGDRLFLSPRTVEAHIRSIFTKLDL